MENISPKKLKAEMEKGTGMTIVDLQSKEKYEHSHIPGAINIPLELFKCDYPGILKDLNLTIVLYGEFDDLGKASEAGKMLEAAKYSQVGRLEGGLMGWQEAGFVTEGGIES